MAGRAAVLLDRDGVLNVVRRGEYTYRWEQFQWLPGAREAVARLTRDGWPVVVITNQSGVGRGLYTGNDVDDIHNRMGRELEQLGGRIEAFYFCPHTDEDACECRKPRPGLLHRAAQDLGLDMARCFFVGDTASDMEAGRAAGCRVLAVTSGLSTAEEIARWSPAPERVFDSVLDAAIWLSDRFAAAREP